MFEKIKTNITPEFNNFVCDVIIESAIFKVAYGETWRGDSHHVPEDIDGSRISDAGMICVSYDVNNSDNNPKNMVLNSYANFIFDSIMKDSKYAYTNVHLVRYIWNYYNRGSTGIFHVDFDENSPGYYDIDGNVANRESVLYNLTSTDGGTIIDDDFVRGVGGEAIIFNSIDKHRGVGPIKAKARIALNVVFSYDEKILK